MMRQITISLIVAVHCILQINAQDSLSVQLLSLEQKAFMSQNEREQNLFFLEKTKLYLKNNLFGAEVLEEMKRVDHRLIADSAERKTYLWNAALVAHLNHDFNSSRNYISRLFEFKNDTTADEALLAVMVYNENDTAKLSLFVKKLTEVDKENNCLRCMNEVVAYKRKGKLFSVISSYVIPGSGSIMNGYVLKGAVSLLIFAGIGTATYFLVANELYLNALFFTAPWLGKFYGGQIRLTKKLFNEKEMKKKGKLAKRCAEDLNKLLIKYPVIFKS